MTGSQQSFFLGRHAILKNQMASDRLVKRLHSVYSIFMLYFRIRGNSGIFVLSAVWYIAITPFAIFGLPPFLPGHDIHDLTWYLGLAFIYSFLAQIWWNRHQKSRDR